MLYIDFSQELLKYLFYIDRAGSWKNSYLSTFSEIFQEALWFDCIVSRPQFQTFVRHSKKADILTTKELNALFKEDDCPNERAKIAVGYAKTMLESILMLLIIKSITKRAYLWSSSQSSTP